MKKLLIFTLFNLLISPFNNYKNLQDTGFNSNFLAYDFFYPMVIDYPKDRFSFGGSFSSVTSNNYSTSTTTTTQQSGDNYTGSIIFNAISLETKANFQFMQQVITSGVTRYFYYNSTGTSGGNQVTPTYTTNLPSMSMILSNSNPSGTYTQHSTSTINGPYMTFDAKNMYIEGGDYRDIFYPIKNKYSGVIRTGGSNYNPTSIFYVVYAMNRQYNYPIIQACTQDNFPLGSSCVVDNTAPEIKIVSQQRIQINPNSSYGGDSTTSYYSVYLLGFEINYGYSYQLDFSNLPNRDNNTICPIYVGFSIPSDISAFFGLLTDNEQKLYDALTSADTSNIDNSNSSLSNQVDDLNNKQDALFDDFNSNIDALDTDTTSFLMSISSSANWVRERFDSITYETPWGVYLQYTLLIGFAILIIGRRLK